MQKTLKRMISIVLTLLLTFSMFAALSVSAGAEETVTAVPEVAGVSVTLDGSIGLNIFVNENGCEDYSVSYSIDGYADQVVINFSDGADPVYSDDNQYRIYTFKLPASQMNDDITFTVTYGDGEDDYAEYNYSVAQYAKEIISGDQDTYLSNKGFTSGRLDALKALCKSMLYYGAQAQLQFQYHTGFLANEGVEYTASAIDSSVFEGLDQYESYPNESGDWIIRGNSVHAFVNSYDWENVYAHIVLTEYKCVEGEYIGFFTEDTVMKLTKSGEIYQAEGDEAAKDIYYFDSALSDYSVVYTDSENSLKDTRTENYCRLGIASSIIIRNLDNEEGTCDYASFYGIDFVNSQNWTNVSAKVTYSVFDQEKW